MKPLSRTLTKTIPILVLVALLIGCGADAAEPSPTSEPTPTATPASALTSTPVPTPTASPVPTPTPEPVSLPQDDSPHDWPNTEWWYYNGSLSTAGGERYGFHYVVFKFDFPFVPTTNVAHLSIVDHQSSTVLTDQRIEQAEVQPPEAPGFSFDIDGWTMEGVDGIDQISAEAEGLAFDLTLQSKKPPVLHGGTGFIDLGPLGGNYYYSRTRMDISGAVRVQGREAPVTGTAWFDHQWGGFRIAAGGWDWLALRLDDNSELMLYTLRDEEMKPVQSFGTYVPPMGEAIALEDPDFDIRATGSWTSLTSGAEYPMGWIVKVPGLDIDIILDPVVVDAEFDATSTTGNYYWEGEVQLGGSHGGWGYVELVGYAPAILPERLD